MNILPHKSWHVWSTKNMARVERDEADQRKLEAERKRKAEFAKSELRIEKLRRKSAGGRTQAHASTAPADDGAERVERFHLFEKEERAGASAENPQVLEDQRRRREREMKDTREYLGGGGRAPPPWYAAHDDTRGRRGDADGAPSARQHASASLAQRRRERRRDEKRKEEEDPLPSRPDRHRGERREHPRPADRRSREDEDADDDRDTRGKKREKKKGERRHKKERLVSLETLRAQRRARESSEKTRIDGVLRGRVGADGPRSAPAEVADDRERDYHAGYTLYSGGRRRRSQHDHQEHSQDAQRSPRRSTSRQGAR